MSEVCKQIYPGFHLKIKKRLAEKLIDFALENRTEFVFLFHFIIKDPQNIEVDDNEFEKKVKVLSGTHFSFMQCRVEGAFNYRYEFKYQKLNPEPIIKEVEISPELMLTIIQQDMEQKISFELCNRSDVQVHFELTILELSGIRSACGKTLFIVDSEAKSKIEVCELNFDGQWSYKYSFTYAVASNKDIPNS